MLGKWYLLPMVLLLSCAKSEIVAQRFFPIRVGDIRVYEIRDKEHVAKNVNLISTVVGERMFNDLTYFEVREYKPDSNSGVTSTYKAGSQYIRIGKDGNMYEYLTDKNGSPIKDQLKYKFDSNIGDSWTYSTVGPFILDGKHTLDEYKVTLESKSDTIRIGNSVYTNCYRFYFDMPRSSDEEYYEWIAGGIGVIMTKPAYWGGSVELRAYYTSSR